MPPKKRERNELAGLALTAVESEVIDYVEARWLARGGWPTPNDLHERWPTFDLEESMKKIGFVNALICRGISFPTKLQSRVGYLTPAQVAAVAVMSDFMDTRRPAAKLKSLGVTTAQWNAWKKNPNFTAYMRRVVGGSFDESLEQVQAGLMRAVDAGKVDAIKFYMEATGRYQASSAEVQNLKLVLAQLLEAVQRNVQDPNTLRAIGGDFERIMGSGITTGGPQPQTIESPVEDLLRGI